MSTTETIVTIVGLALLSVLTRGFFLLPRRAVPLPSWFHQGLRFVPLAALVAILVPEVLMKDGVLITTFKDARLYAALAAAAYYYWRRGIFGTIVAGLSVLIPLKVALGW